jgi:exonuclease I
MSAALAVLRMATALEPDPVVAMAWYRGVPITVLDGLTAAELVKQGRAHAVLGFLHAAIEIDREEARAPQ